jgi:hypothetical protein
MRDRANRNYRYIPCIRSSLSVPVTASMLVTCSLLQSPTDTSQLASAPAQTATEPPAASATALLIVSAFCQSTQTHTLRPAAADTAPATPCIMKAGKGSTARAAIRDSPARAASAAWCP